MKKKINVNRKTKEIISLYRGYRDLKKISEVAGNSIHPPYSLDDKIEGINPFYKSDTFNYG